MTAQHGAETPAGSPSAKPASEGPLASGESSGARAGPERGLGASSAAPITGTKSAALWPTALGLFALALVVTTLLWWPARNVPFLGDDLVAGAWLEPAEGDPGGVSAVLWPDDPRFDFNHHVRPLAWLSLEVDRRLFGWDPRGFRAVAWIWHAAAAAMLGLVARVLLRRHRGPTGSKGDEGSVVPWLACLAFAAHPAAFEAVVWVCHRFTLMATFGLAGATAAALAYGASGGRARLLLVAAASGLAVFSKDSALAFGAITVMATFLGARGLRQRLVRGAAAAAAHATLIVCNLTWRFAATGHWLPTLEERSDARLEGWSARWEAACAYFHSLFLDPLQTPLSQGGDGQLFAGVLGPLALLIPTLTLAVGLLGALGLFATGRRWLGEDPVKARLQAAASRSALALTLGAFVLAIPVLQVASEELAGARRFHWPLLGVALCLSLVPGRVGRALVLLLLVAFAVQSVRHAERYAVIGKAVDTMVHDVVEATALMEGQAVDSRGEPVAGEAMASSGTLYVTGLPVGYAGTPVYGLERSMIDLRFQAPFAQCSVAVHGVSPEVWGEDPGALLSSGAQGSIVLAHALDAALDGRLPQAGLRPGLLRVHWPSQGAELPKERQAAWSWAHPATHSRPADQRASGEGQAAPRILKDGDPWRASSGVMQSLVWTRPLPGPGEEAAFGSPRSTTQVALVQLDIPAFQARTTLLIPTLTQHEDDRIVHRLDWRRAWPQTRLEVLATALAQPGFRVPVVLSGALLPKLGVPLEEAPAATLYAPRLKLILGSE